MYSDFDGTLLRELEHIDSTVTVLSTFNNGGLEVGSPNAAFHTVIHVVKFRNCFYEQYWNLFRNYPSFSFISLRDVSLKASILLLIRIDLNERLSEQSIASRIFFRKNCISDRKNLTFS